MVGGIEALEERERADAVDARVGPEIHEHDMAPELFERERAPAGSVEPALGVGELGRRAQLGQVAARARVAGIGELRRRAQRGETRLDGVGVLKRSRRVDEECRQARVLGERLLEAHVEIRGHDDGRGKQHAAEHVLDHAAAGRALDPVEHSAAAEPVEQQHGTQPDRVSDRHRNHARRRPARGADRGHGGQDRAGARRAHEPERATDGEAGPEARPARPRAEAGQARERRLHAGGEARHEQHDPEAGQHRDGERASGAAGQSDTLDELGQGHDRDRERAGQADDDAERTPATAERAG